MGSWGAPNRTWLSSGRTQALGVLHEAVTNSSSNFARFLDVRAAAEEHHIRAMSSRRVRTAELRNASAGAAREFSCGNVVFIFSDASSGGEKSSSGGGQRGSSGEMSTVGGYLTAPGPSW